MFLKCFSFHYSFKGKSQSYSGRDGEKYAVEPEVLMTKEIEWSNNLENSIRERDMRQGIDLATTLERIEKNFVISDPRLPDNPIVRIFFSHWCSMCMLNIFLLCLLKIAFKVILLLSLQIFASDSFLELTEYTREEILGRNCRYKLFYIFVYKRVSFFFSAVFSFRNTLLMDFCLLLIDCHFSITRFFTN